MTVYLVAHIRIHDRARYAEYETGFARIFSQYNGTLLAVDDDTHQLEGENPADRSVVISFPTEGDALAWYRSAEYQALAQHRFAASEAELTLIRAGMNTRPT
jgi:uncharacterized protein (DUF1330 family)